MNSKIVFQISCNLVIKSGNIDDLTKSINPDNNISSKKLNYNIRSNVKSNQVDYKFTNFKNLTTLRLTLDDLLSHLEFARTVNLKINKE